MKKDQVSSAPRAELAGSLSGLELRKSALEVLGWTHSTRVRIRYGRIPGVGLVSEANALSVPGMISPTGEPNVFEELPAVESDPAISEPMFLNWMAKFKWARFEQSWDRTRPLSFYCNVVAEGSCGNVSVTACGDTPSEARARAIASARSPKISAPLNTSRAAL